MASEKPTQKRYPPELKQRAVRMVVDIRSRALLALPSGEIVL